MSKVILDLCGGTGSWSQPYREAGYDVRTIDIRYGGDVRLYEPVRGEQVHGVLAAPPCTDLALSGARYWKEKGQAGLLAALSIADACMRIVLIHKPQWWAIENPKGRLVHYYGKPRMRFNPCDYGDPYTKETLLWGDFNIPEKTPVEPKTPNPIWYAQPGPDRARLRSVTPKGFATAFFKSNP